MQKMKIGLLVSTIYVFLLFLVVVWGSPRPDDYVVGVFPSLGIILQGLLKSLAQGLGLLLSTVLSGSPLSSMFSSLFQDVQTDVDPGVDDLENTLDKPITSIE